RRWTLRFPRWRTARNWAGRDVYFVGRTSEWLLNGKNLRMEFLTMGKLTNQVAVVTGASKGIGAGIAKALAAEGAAAVVNYSSSKAGADKVVLEITAKGGKAIAVQADVSKHADVVRLFAEVKKAYGKVNILVNNAGIYEFSPLEGVTEEHFHKHFN